LSLAFSEVWGEAQASRPRFWALTFDVARETRVAAIGQLIGPMTIAEQAQDLADLQPLLDALVGSDSQQPAAELILAHLVGAILVGVKRGAHVAGPEAGPWMALAGAVAHIKTDNVMAAVRILLQNGTEKTANLTASQTINAGRSLTRPGISTRFI
jgi:hypothetical protein